MSQNSDDDDAVVNAAHVLAELVNPTLNQLTQAIGQLIEQQQAANNLMQTMVERQAAKESDDKKEDTKVEDGTHKQEQPLIGPVVTPGASEETPLKPLSRRLSYAPPPQKGAGLCLGCGHSPCPTPVTDQQLTDALKAVKLLKAPEGGPFKGVSDNRTGISFERETKKCCGRMSSVVLYHYLLQHTTQSAQDALEVGEEWPANCHRDYEIAVGGICTKLLTVFSNQASSEGILQAWNALQQKQDESVESFISRVLAMTTELRLAGLERPEREVKAKLRCGLAERDLQSTLLQHSRLSLSDFMEKMVEEMIDRRRETHSGESTSVPNPKSTTSTTSKGDKAGGQNPTTSKLPPPVIELDEVHLNGINAGQLPSGAPGCARGCGDSACRGVRYCTLKLPNLPPEACSRCGRAHPADQVCPAVNKVCARCNRGGHFAAACRSAPSGRQHSRPTRRWQGDRRGQSQQAAKGDPNDSNKQDQSKEDKQHKVTNAIINIDDVPSDDDILPDIFALSTSPPPKSADNKTRPNSVPTESLKGPQVKTPVSKAFSQLPGHVITVMALWDTGATANFVRADVLETLAKRGNTSLRWPEKGSRINATLADNLSRVPLQGTCLLVLKTPRATATITAYVVRHLSLPLVIGVPALQALRVKLEFSPQGRVRIRTGYVEGTYADPYRGDLVQSMTARPRPFMPRPCVIQPERSHDEELTIHTLSAPPGQLLHHMQWSRIQPILNFVDINNDTSIECELSSVQETPVMLPREAIHIDSTRSGRLVADFTYNSDADFEALQGKGWKAAVSRAQRSSYGKTLEQKNLINDAIDKLLSSDFVGYLKLKTLSHPPPTHSIARLYESSDLIRQTHLVQDRYLQAHQPVYIPAQAVFKRTSSTTPCRLVYDMRMVNKTFTLPTVSRWNLWDYLVQACTSPVCKFMDAEKAFNQVLLTSKSAASCATVLMKAKTPQVSRPEAYVVLWTSMPFGAGPSPGGLEAATEVWIEESKQLSKTLVPPHLSHTNPLPDFYTLDSFKYCRPIIQDAFENRPLEPGPPLHLLDYVDDYAVIGDSLAQLNWHTDLVEAAAGHRGFRFPAAKKYQSWDSDNDNKLLGYHLRNDLLSPVFSAEPLPEGAPSPVTKRAVSHTLASLYDPLGRYIEHNMMGRSLWRSVVDSTREEELPSALTWNKAVPNGLVQAVNRWVKAVSALPPTPRFIPVRWRHPTSSEYKHCQLLVSCDASNIAWCVDVRSKVNGLPIGPRLCGRGGLFPQRRTYSPDGRSTSTPTSTVPRLELHSLLQATKELLRLCSATRVSPTTNTTAIIMSDSLINIQRLCRMGNRSETELVNCIGKKGKCNYTRGDLAKLLKIRQNLKDVPIPVTLIHLPSALNLADDGSRCRAPSRGPEETELLEAILQDPSRRPNYIPGDTRFEDCSLDEDEQTNDCSEGDEPGSVALCATAPQAGPLPTPFSDQATLPTLTEADRATIDDAIEDSIKKDGFYNAVRSYLKDGTVADGYSPARLKRQATNFELDTCGRLFRIVRQRPDATVVRQRVISGHAHDIINKIIITRHLEWHHLGPQKLTIRLSDSFYWPRQRRTVTRALKRCIPCLKTNAIRQFNSSAGCQHVADLRPGQVQACDIYLPNVKVDGEQSGNADRIVAALVMTDLASGFQRLQPIHGSATSANVCSALDLLFTNVHFPTVLITDNGKSFVSNLTARWCRDRSILQLSCPVYAPALAYWERSHREISRALKACLFDHTMVGTWFDKLVQVVNHLNDAPYNSDSWLSPRLVAHPHYDINHYYNTNSASVNDLAKKLTTVSQPAVAERVRESGKKTYTIRMLDYLNHWTTFKEASRARTLAHHGRPCDLAVGDTVFHLTGQSSKLSSRVAGPYIVDTVDEDHKGTVIIRGADHCTCRVWVSNLVKVPPLKSEGDTTTSTPSPDLSPDGYAWTLDHLPPIQVLPPPNYPGKR